ncbi:signal peptidase I [Brevibacillus choshinensis]|uniref:signal peptidase I n=1 Tax=Brevibacillus choshinensis TaxID=54911 RepID=UPI002E247B18|nr:signal peptidase I [Brevibacillus choshinensis]MED4586376.1 signal peptidase I [Brevibacillus choshinensis]MED4754301.1 signal peptidase I [Brevibacillus choshinensis]
MVILKKVASVVTTVFLVLVIALTGFLFIGKMSGGKTTLLGSEIMVVLSGSMAPTFNTGSVVAVKPVKFEEIKKGDIITFKNEDDLTVTHRVVEITDGKLITRGDANNGNDSIPVTADRLLGKVQYSVPVIGYVIEFIRSKVGMLVFLGLPGIYLIISQIWKLFKMMKEAEAQAS